MMGFDNAVVATVSGIKGEVFVSRDGKEIPLQEDMALQAGDVLRSTSGSSASISIPGTEKQIPAVLAIANGGQATLALDPTAGPLGKVMITSNAGQGEGSVVLTSEGEGEDHAALLDGEAPETGEMSALFGAGLLGVGAGGAALPLAGAVGAAAVFSGVADDDDESTDTPGRGAEDAGGLVETVSDLTNNLSEVTEPIPGVNQLVDTVGSGLESVLIGDFLGSGTGGLDSAVGGLVGGLVDASSMAAEALEGVPVFGELAGTLNDVLVSVATGDNEGGVSSVTSGLGEGLESGLAETPLAPVGEGANAALETLSGVLAGVGDAVSELGVGSPLPEATVLIGEALGAQGGDLDLSLEAIPVLGDLIDTVSGALNGGGDLLSGVPVVSEVLEGGILGGLEGGLLAEVPVVSDILTTELLPGELLSGELLSSLLDGLTPGISSSGTADGGAAGVPLLGNLTQNLG